MERLIQLLDDVDDFCALLRHRLGWWPRTAAARPSPPAPAAARAAMPLKTPG